MVLQMSGVSKRLEKKMKKKYYIYLLKLFVLDYLPITSVVLKEARKEVDI